MLQRLPSSGGGFNSKFNNSGNLGNPPDGGGVGAGAAEIDLRYLGSRRVLVLVDGLRYVNGASASGVPGSTDLNSIPDSAIERIEVLQDGASAIYGSDAIAGVVNIITKRRQNGFLASVQAGVSGRKAPLHAELPAYLGMADGRSRSSSRHYVDQAGSRRRSRDLCLSGTISTPASTAVLVSSRSAAQVFGPVRRQLDSRFVAGAHCLTGVQPANPTDPPRFRCSRRRASLRAVQLSPIPSSCWWLVHTRYELSDTIHLPGKLIATAQVEEPGSAAAVRRWCRRWPDAGARRDRDRRDQPVQPVRR